MGVNPPVVAAATARDTPCHTARHPPTPARAIAIVAATTPGRITAPATSLTCRQVRRGLGRIRSSRTSDGARLDAVGVTKQWRGLVTEAFTDADTYVVDLVVATEPMRSLALAAALSIDIVMKEKDT